MNGLKLFFLEQSVSGKDFINSLRRSILFISCLGTILSFTSGSGVPRFLWSVAVSGSEFSLQLCWSSGDTRQVLSCDGGSCLIVRVEEWESLLTPSVSVHMSDYILCVTVSVWKWVWISWVWITPPSCALQVLWQGIMSCLIECVCVVVRSSVCT